MTVRIVHPLLAAAALAAVAAPVRADRIDAKLLTQAPTVLAALKKHGTTGVGVLRFRIDRGEKLKDSFAAGPANDGMAARVENLLVLNADKDHPIPVARDPNREASGHKIGAWYTNPAERRKLFELSYPPAWGTARVAPDAFLTGEVKCTGDMTKTTVTIEMFTKSAPDKIVPVTQFTVDTDRLILADLGAHFNVAKRGGKGAAVKRGADLDRFAIGEARRRDELTDLEPAGDPAGKGSTGSGSKPSTGTEPRTEPANVPVETLTDLGGITFQLLADGDPQSITRATTATASWQVISPEQAAKVTFVLNNTTDKRLGVVLKLNGVSTIFEQVEDPAACRKWVIEPGKSITVKGFYREGGQVAPFKVLVGDEAAAVKSQFGEKAGQIQIAVFDEVPEGETESKEPGSGGPETTASLPRRLPDSKGVARRDLHTLQEAMMKAARLKKVTKTETVGGRAVKREIIVPSEATETGEVKEVDFTASPEPVAAELVQIVKR